jgi:hypothetical protein
MAPKPRLEKEPITKDKLQCLMSKSGNIPDEKQKEGDTKPLQPSQQDRTKARRAPLRPCRHCGASHWDFDCPARKWDLDFGPTEKEKENESLDPCDERDFASD